MIGVAQTIDFYEKNSSILNEKINQLKQSNASKSILSCQEIRKQSMLNRLELADKIFKMNSL